MTRLTLRAKIMMCCIGLVALLDLMVIATWLAVRMS